MHGYEGQSSTDCVYSDGSEYRTCPRTYLFDPVVASVYADVDDYKRGAFGNVLDLPAPFLEYLRAASNAMDKWQTQQQAALMDDG